MKISARNKLKGIVKEIREGVVSTEVTIELSPGVEITSVITKTSVVELELAVGKKVYAVIKASNVMLGVDH
ncbi:MAG: TOBE domain-containing protein [Bacteroidales bacterium]